MSVLEGKCVNLRPPADLTLKFTQDVSQQQQKPPQDCLEARYPLNLNIWPPEKTPGFLVEHRRCLEERQSVNSSLKTRFQKMSPDAEKHLSPDNPAGLIWSAARATAERDPAMAIMARGRQRHCQRSADNRKYVLAADYGGWLFSSPHVRQITHRDTCAMK